MLVLEPIFEADLPPEQYAYRPGRNAQQAVVEVEAQLFRGHPEVVDADLGATVKRPTRSSADVDRSACGIANQLCVRRIEFIVLRRVRFAPPSGPATSLRLRSVGVRCPALRQVATAYTLASVSSSILFVTCP